MALNMKDRVKDTTTTTGTGTYTLANTPPSGFRSFSVVGNGNTCYYVVANTTDWEVGLGTVTVGGSVTLARTTILASSNGGAAVNWGAGTKDAAVTFPADGLMLGANNLTELASASAARANLGLGTAATLNAGVGANNLVQLNASAELPAVDGHNLTNVATFPAGTKALFAQAAAPTGWTQVTTWNDRVLRVVSGGTGGGTGGAWAISGINGTALTQANLPTASPGAVYVHTRQVLEAAMEFSAGAVTVVDAVDDTLDAGDTVLNVPSNGDGTTHTHGGDGNWRPAYLDVIVASKN